MLFNTNCFLKPLTEFSFPPSCPPILPTYTTDFLFGDFVYCLFLQTRRFIHWGTQSIASAAAVTRELFLRGALMGECALSAQGGRLDFLCLLLLCWWGTPLSSKMHCLGHRHHTTPGFPGASPMHRAHKNEARGMELFSDSLHGPREIGGWGG